MDKSQAGKATGSGEKQESRRDGYSRGPVVFKLSYLAQSPSVPALGVPYSMPHVLFL